ncbi:MAG TPA: carbohydrate ABC transporter permease [Gryllotalpicola sp.]
MRRYNWKTLSWEIWMIIVALVFCLPFYLLIAVALKSPADLFTTSPSSFPIPPNFANFGVAWQASAGGGLGVALMSSLIITVGTLVVLIVFGSLCAYALARRPGKLSNVLYFLFVLGIIVPFQLSIIPLYVGFRHLGLVGTYLGMIILWVGIGSPMTVFLYTGFVRSLPKDYEEAAKLDGASALRTFWSVVFPLLRPATGTVAILMGLFIWNDFFTSLVFLGGSNHQTLPVVIYSFVGQYVSQWEYVFAAVILAILPVVIFFVIAQRQLIRGFAGGIRG